MGQEMLLEGQELEDFEGKYRPHITSTPLEVADLIEINIGRWALFIFNIFLVIDTELSLAAQTSVFAASFTDEIPLIFFDTCNVYETTSIFEPCRLKYIVWVAVFVLICMFLTVIGVTEMKVM
jgi:hypothetical protein